MDVNIGTIKLSPKQEPQIEGRYKKILLNYMEDHQIDSSGSNYDLLNRILLHLFPPGIQNSIIISNIELKTITSGDEKVGRWLIGPKIVSNDLAGSEIIYFRCRRHYNRLFVDGIIAKYENISPYDLRGSCMIEIGDKVFNEASTISNLLNIPQRRKQVKDRAEEWSEYLDWQEKYVLKNQFSARVLNVGYELDKGGIELEVAIPFEYEKKLHVLRRDVAMVWVRADISSNEKLFIPDEKKRYDTNKIGTISNKQVKVRRNRYSQDELGRDEQSYRIFIELEDDLINRMTRSDNPDRYIPKQGDFLLNAVGGDLAPIINQKRALVRLQQQEMVNFNVGDFIFNYSEAVPSINIISELPYDPLEENINETQKLALLKILSAQDIALVQGPPGTGKTTIIAELCYQLAKQGKRVLVSSQTNLAVDNALSRLHNKEEILPIRLGYATEEGQQFVEENVVDYWFNSVEENIALRISKEKEINKNYEVSNQIIQIIEKTVLQINQLQERISEIVITFDAQKDEITKLQQSISTSSKDKQVLVINKSFLQNIHSSSDQSLFRRFIENNQELNAEVQIYINPGQYTIFSETDSIELYMTAIESRSLIEVNSELLSNVQKLKVICGGETDLISHELDKLSIERENLKSATSELELLRLLEVNRRIQDIKNRTSVFDQNEWFDLVEQTSQMVKSYTTLSKIFEPLEMILKPDDNSLEILDLLEKAISQTINLISTSLSIENKLKEVVNKEINALDVQIINFEDNNQILQQSMKEMQSKINSIENKLSSNRSQINTLYSQKKKSISTLEANTGLSIIQEIQDLTPLKTRIDKWYQESKSEHNISQTWMDFREKWFTKIRNRSKKDLDDLTGVYIDAANVVGATCYYSGQRKFYENANKFDYVIVDEVSKATAPELLMPMLLGEKIVLVGDHRQLPPLFKEEKSFKESDDPHAEETLRRYKKLVTTSYFEDAWNEIDGSLKERLIEQYRMHEHIMRAVNLFYQDNPLKLGSAQLNQTKMHNLSVAGFISPNSHLLWIDSSTSKINGKEVRNYAEQPENSKSRFNQLELDVIKNLLYILNREGKDLKVGVITFYGAQVKKIRDLINGMRNNLENLELTYGTVDRFQGAEREIIIVSLVGALRGRRVTGFVRDFRRINVAISRAQKLLIIVGAMEDFQNARIDLEEIGGSRSSQPYQTIIDLVKQNNGNFSATKIIGINSETERN